ncbi:MAG: hypothetical protein LBT88_06665 [Oscillospiraceae bacterium]|jgi:hypothetical protein|nr:hypothetical protein [Oscillospiraceae bacterium]
MKTLALDIAKMVELLPEHDQRFACEFVKKLVIAWDPDFSKVTPQEAERIRSAEESGFFDDESIDWDNLNKYADS